MSDEQLAAELKAADPERYLSVLYAPADKRKDLVALYAFNAEIAGIRDRIRDPLPGEVRLQWWRDAIAGGTQADAGGHPLATALLATIEHNELPKAAFQNYLDARVFDLYDDPMPTRGDLEGYLGETSSMLIQLAALILDREAAQQLAEKAGHAGCAQGIAHILQRVPLARSRGQCFIPGDLLAAAGITPEELVAGSNDAGAVRAIAAMVALGREHWAKAQRIATPGTLRPAFAATSSTPDLLAAVERAGTSALTSPVRISPLTRFWRTLRGG